MLDAVLSVTTARIRLAIRTHGGIVCSSRFPCHFVREDTVMAAFLARKALPLERCWHAASPSQHRPTRPAATSPPRTRTSCSRPRRCSSPGTRQRRSRPSPCSPSSKATPSTSAWSSRRRPAQAARDAARLLQAPGGLHDPEEARVAAVEAAAVDRRELAACFGGRGAAPRPRKTQQGGDRKRRPSIKVLEAGVVGSLDYKIIEADRADDLFQWLKDNKYSYAGDEATLDFYVQKKWLFTVMKIDTMQMKKNKDGTFAGEVTPTRFQFASDKLVYPLKITQISVKDKTEALFYVQAPYKVDLPGDMTYQYTWVPMLQAATGCTPGGIPGGGDDWLKAIERPDPRPAAARPGARLQLRQRPAAAAQQARATSPRRWNGPAS